MSSKVFKHSSPQAFVLVSIFSFLRFAVDWLYLACYVWPAPILLLSCIPKPHFCTLLKWSKASPAVNTLINTTPSLCLPHYFRGCWSKQLGTGDPQSCRLLVIEIAFVPTQFILGLAPCFPSYLEFLGPYELAIRLFSCFVWNLFYCFPYNTTKQISVLNLFLPLPLPLQWSLIYPTIFRIYLIL